ncbi:hypothetical protein CQB02_23040 [Escherichia coli]|nr:hypothetical protein CQB02_23040 [Escherichia coli]
MVKENQASCYLDKRDFLSGKKPVDGWLQVVDKVHFIHAGCGVDALSGLRKYANSKHYRDKVGLISVAHQAILRLSSVLSQRMTAGFFKGLAKFR